MSLIGQKLLIGALSTNRHFQRDYPGGVLTAISEHTGRVVWRQDSWDDRVSELDFHTSSPRL